MCTKRNSQTRLDQIRLNSQPIRHHLQLSKVTSRNVSIGWHNAIVVEESSQRKAIALRLGDLQRNGILGEQVGPWQRRSSWKHTLPRGGGKYGRYLRSGRGMVSKRRKRTVFIATTWTSCFDASQARRTSFVAFLPPPLTRIAAFRRTQVWHVRTCRLTGSETAMKCDRKQSEDLWWSSRILEDTRNWQIGAPTLPLRRQNT
jgi:hypothetical protein